MTPFSHLAIIGCGLIGSSIARAAREAFPDMQISGWDADADVCARAAALNIFDHVAHIPGPLLHTAGLIIFCVPVGAMEQAARSIAPHIADNAIISDVGSCKESVTKALHAHLPQANIIPAHPVAGTENSGPEAGFASLFKDRWCILTPQNPDDPAIAPLSAFWQALGSQVTTMPARHHDMVLAITSHLPHLIAYTIVGTASDLEDVTRSEVIKYSAGGFRDFTRIAASDPVMWRDVFLNNKDAVLEMLQRFTEDLTALQRAIRRDEGDALQSLFTRTRDIRRSIIDEGQDDPAPDFGRQHD